MEDAKTIKDTTTKNRIDEELWVGKFKFLKIKKADGKYLISITALLLF